MIKSMKISLLAAMLFSPMALFAQSAVVIDFEANECALLNGNGKIVAAAAGKQIVTNSQKDNTILTCSAKVAPADDGKAAIFNKAKTGYVCYTWKGYTENWQNTVSANGNAKLVCRYKN